jgi:hypothetical protein
MALAFNRINWQLLSIHFLAVPCFILGGQQLQLTRWVPMMEAYQSSGVAGMQQESGVEGLSGILSQMWTGPLYAWALAVLAGCLLSALVVWRRRESRLIPVLMFGLAIVTSWTHYYESATTRKGVHFLRGLFAHYSWEAQLLLVGSTLILIGLLPFLLTWKRTTEQAIVAL